MSNAVNMILTIIFLVNCIRFGTTRVIMLRNLDFRSNGIPQTLKIDDTPFSNLSDKAEDGGSSMNKVQDTLESDMSKELRRKDLHDEAIQQDLNEIEDVLAPATDNGASDKLNLVQIKYMLKEIKEMLKKEHKGMEVDKENFKSYVPISEDVENPQPLGIGKMTIFDGFNVINRGRKLYDIV